MDTSEFYRKTLIEGNLIDNTFFWTPQNILITSIILIVGFTIIGICTRNIIREIRKKKREDAEVC